MRKKWVILACQFFDVLSEDSEASNFEDGRLRMIEWKNKNCYIKNIWIKEMCYVFW